MRVRKTKSGKLSLEVGQIDRENVWDALVGFCEPESIKLMDVKLNVFTNITQHLYYSVLEQMMLRLDFALYFDINKKWVITKPEAIALMWLLRNHDHTLQMLDLKASLHKILN